MKPSVYGCAQVQVVLIEALGSAQLEPTAKRLDQLAASESDENAADYFRLTASLLREYKERFRS